MRLPFEGIKVIDLGMAAVAPLCAQALGEFGATVIRVETHRHFDITRVAAPFVRGEPGINSSYVFARANSNKLGMTLDFNRPRSKEVIGRLVRWADVICAGLTPGLMERWGLDYESCRQINPRVIYCYTSQMGKGGPLSSVPGYGILGGAFAGLSHLLGDPEGPPYPIYNYLTDYVAPYYLFIAILGALMQRERTGKGMYIDQSQVEAGVTLIGPLVLNYLVNRRESSRMGNRDPYMAPHGLYPCRDGSLIAIAVENDDQWEGLKEALEKPFWTEDDRFSSLLKRKQNEDELDRLLSQKTKEFDGRELMRKLQEKGVPAGIVATGQDICEDPQLISRGAFVKISHPVLGEYYPRKFLGCIFSELAPRFSKPSPCIGEDNEFVYKEILGFSDDEIADLIAEGVITTDADLDERWASHG